ncbi:MAG: carbamate kinase [Thermoplasmata archaeon]|nr:carbamate kinase [Thermoplasmata archaeon]
MESRTFLAAANYKGRPRRGGRNYLEAKEAGADRLIGGKAAQKLGGPMKLAVVGVGGNAIAPPSGPLTWTGQLGVVRSLVPPVRALRERGYRLVVTHGNGPQVGALLSQQEIAAVEVPPYPLDVLVAQSQAQIGYALQTVLLEALNAGEGETPVTLVTMVAVDPNDPEFQTPSKPIGPLLPESRARELERSGATMAEDPRGGFRRLVPSPWPLGVVGASQILDILNEASPVVIAGGGGGVPVVREGAAVRGIEAVVDKDLTSSLLARELDAELLLLLTDVPHVSRDFGTEEEQPIDELTAEEAEELLLAGEFPPGTMGPKVRGAVDFLKGGGRLAVIVDLEGATRALDGGAGTRIVP